MYFFTMYNISPIQQGIQSGHAALEYAYIYGDTPQYLDFIRNHKTFIILNGGTSSDMEARKKELADLGVRYATFYEPDLNYSLSAIAFLVEAKDYACDPESPTPLKEYLNQFRLA